MGKQTLSKTGEDSGDRLRADTGRLLRENFHESAHVRALKVPGQIHGKRERTDRILQSTRLLAYGYGILDLLDPHAINGDVALVAGDLALARFEERLAETWPRCLDDNPSSAADAFRVTTAFHRIIGRAASAQSATVAVLDVGPSLGALNRAAIVAADYLVVPLAADLFSLRGLRNLGPTLAEWRTGWEERRKRPRVPGGLDMPAGAMKPLGYVVLQHAARKAAEPARAYARWIDRFPQAFHASVLGDAAPVGDDPFRIALLRHFRSLLPMALEARKPIFDLTAADGAIGSHAATVRHAREIFENLAKTIGTRAGVGQWAGTS